MAQRPVRDRPSPPPATESKRKIGWLVALGLLAALAFALATLPATVLTGTLGHAGLEASSLTGSVWSGRAAGLAWRGAPLGEADWKISATSLLRGRLAGDVALRRPDGTASARVAASPGGELRVEALEADLPVEAVASLPIGVPKGWRGRLSARFEELVLEDGWPTALRGSVVMQGLVAPPPRNALVGSFDVVIPDPKGPPGADGTLAARVTDRDGPFAVDARLTVSRDRSFLLDGTLMPRGRVAPELERSLQLLGPADTSGRRPFSVSGTF